MPCKMRVTESSVLHRQVKARVEIICPRDNLILGDIRLPDGDVYDLCSKFRRIGMRQPVLSCCLP